MIKQFKVKNYKSIKHDMLIKFKDTGEFLGIWGNNDTGKSNLVDAISTAKEIFHEGMRYVRKDLYYIFDVDDRNKPTHFEFEFGFEGRMYRYGFLVSFFKGEVLSEYLYKKIHKKEVKLYEKNQSDIKIGDVFDLGLSKEDKERLSIYLHDLKFDKKSLFASHMKEKNFYHSTLSFFNDIYYFFNRICVYKPQEALHFFDDFEMNYQDQSIEFVKQLLPTLTSVSYEPMSLDELRIALGRHRYDHLIDLWRMKALETQQEVFIMSAYDNFYRFKGRDFDKLSIETLEVRYVGHTKSIRYDLLSSGFKHLIHLANILATPYKHMFYVIDELTFMMDAKMYPKFSEIIRKGLKQNKSTLLFTTHDVLFLNQTYFLREEIAFMKKREGVSTLKSLLDYKVRLDKVLDKAYLNHAFDI